MSQKVIQFIGGPRDGMKVTPLGAPPFIVDIQFNNHKVRYVLTKRKEKLFYQIESKKE